MRWFALLVGGCALLLASVAVAVSGGATQAEARWVITDLGTLGRGDFFTYQGFSLASGINDRGQIVGWSWQNEDEKWAGSGHAFFWQNGEMRDLGALLGLPNSRARDINNRGQIVGESFTFPAFGGPETFDRAKSRAVIWENGRMRILAGARAQARSVNERGEVVGWVGGIDSEQPALWQKGAMRKLGRVGKGSSLAVDVNERGQVVGVSGSWNYAEFDLMEVRGFVWESGTIRDLGKLGDWNWLKAINDKGSIVGGRNDHATVWENGVPRRLEGTRGESEAHDINERSQIVGRWKNRAALWENGKLTLLPGLPGGRDEGEAWGINERGQIVGWATTKSIDYSHAVLWTLRRDS